MDIKQAIQQVQLGNLTGKLDSDTVQAVIQAGFPLMTSDGRVRDYPSVEAATEVNYNRGWLLIRRAFLLVNSPGVLIDLGPLAKEAEAAQAKAVALLEAEIKAAKSDAQVNKLRAIQEQARYDFGRHVVGVQCAALRFGGNYSWGEISVRLDQPESTCRNGFNMVSDRKAKGLRNGHGGRFAYDEPVLYQANRKKEGAQIPIDFKMRPKPEDLLNFIRKEEGTSASATQAKRIKQITALLKKAYDSAVGAEERATFEAKAHELCEKYGFDEANFAFKAAA